MAETRHTLVATPLEEFYFFHEVFTPLASYALFLANLALAVG
jgi:hypothetical protein